MFCTVNLPLYGNEVIPITAMYMGKDKDGRYNFIDTGRFIMSKEFIENKAISIDKNFDEEKATEMMGMDKVTLVCDMKQGECSATAWGCDLTYDYIKINADYRS